MVRQKGSVFYNKSMKSWLQDSDLEMYSTHIEEKYIVAERFIRTLMDKIFKYMTSLSKSVYTNELADIVNESNNAYHITIKMKPTVV